MSVNTIESDVTPEEAAVEQREETQLVSRGSFDPRQLITSVPQALRKLNPRDQARNPVMFVVYIGSIVTTVLAIWRPSWFAWLIAAWSWSKGA